MSKAAHVKNGPMISDLGSLFFPQQAFFANNVQIFYSFVQYCRKKTNVRMYNVKILYICYTRCFFNDYSIFTLTPVIILNFFQALFIHLKTVHFCSVQLLVFTCSTKIRYFSIQFTVKSFSVYRFVDWVNFC